MAEEKAISDIVAQAVATAMKAENDRRDALAVAAKAQAAREQEIAQEAVNTYIKAQPSTNDPGFNPGTTVIDADSRKYDNDATEDLGAAIHWVNQANRKRGLPANAAAIKALARRHDSDESKKSAAWNSAFKAMKALGFKADEANYSTNASFGDEWIGVGYSANLWEAIRVNTFVLGKLNPFTFPAGVESLVIPLESTDPVFHTVAQGGDPGSTTRPAPVVPAKAVGTAQVSMTLAKLGSSTVYTGEMVEDAMLPFVPRLRMQIGVAGGEYLESALIDGDTQTSTANINDAGASTPAATDWFMVTNGFRKSPLITTTANSRDGGTLSSADFLETLKLMGGSGINALDRSKVSFIIDPATHYKALELSDIKTRDVFSGATIENGQLTGIYGYGVDVSGQMCKASAVRLSNSTGEVDQDTTTNNTKGSILAVRWDQWQMGIRRGMTSEVERVPRYDGWQITSLMRFGLIQRDTEASAISYNITVG